MAEEAPAQHRARASTAPRVTASTSTPSPKAFPIAHSALRPNHTPPGSTNGRHHRPRRRRNLHRSLRPRKVQFHWDRYGKKDENSSCWIRVSQNWAGSGYGTMHIPRIGRRSDRRLLERRPRTTPSSPAVSTTPCRCRHGTCPAQNAVGDQDPLEHRRCRWRRVEERPGRRQCLAL